MSQVSHGSLEPHAFLRLVQLTGGLPARWPRLPCLAARRRLAADQPGKSRNDIHLKRRSNQPRVTAELATRDR